MKQILQLLFILLIAATVFICAAKPGLHKNVIVYDSAYTLVAEEEVKTETKEIPIMEMPIKPTPVVKVVEEKIAPVQKTVKTPSTPVKKQVVSAPKQTSTIKQTTVKPKTQTVRKSEAKKTEVNVTKEETKTNELPKVVQKSVEHPIVQQKVMSQQEETVAWNKWRSVLTNQIMQDTKLPTLPNGVLFQFSFTVDKFGKISNVQTGANPSNYTPYAIQYIAPVIRSYQGRSILNFPEGTARTTTSVTGKWRISNTQKYSTPQDYNDIEKIVR